jgi:hypothetical protein
VEKASGLEEPAPVLPGQAQDKGDDLVVEGIGASPAATREGPGAGDEVSVRAQEGSPA